MLSAAGASLAAPKPYMGETEFDFGRTAQHGTVSHRFWIENVGDETLEITKVVPGCGCTKAPLLDSVLAPGQKTPLDIFFSTKSFRGIVKKVPYFETNLGEQKFYIKITAELLPDVELDQPIFARPAKVDISQFRPTPPRDKAKFYIHNVDSVDHRLTLIDYAEHAFEVEFPEKVSAGDSVRVVIRLLEDALDTEFDHSVTFSIDGEGEEDIRYSVPIQRKMRVKDRGK
jgi:hypothetical protein